MFLKHSQISPDSAAGLLSAAEAAARAIPPAFPLEATVAVNPFLGQTGADLATTAARLGRVAGARLTLPRAAYRRPHRRGARSRTRICEPRSRPARRRAPADLAALKAAAEQDVPAPKALPTVADLAAEAQRHRLARRDRAQLRPLGRGLFRPRTGALDRRARSGRLRRLAGLGEPRPHARDRRADRLLRPCRRLPRHARARDVPRRRNPRPRCGRRRDRLPPAADGSRRLVAACALAALAGRACRRHRCDADRSAGDPAGLGRGAAGSRRARASPRPGTAPSSSMAGRSSRVPTGWWTRSCRRPPSAPISAGSRASWPHPHRRPRRPGPHCRPPSASTCGRKCSAGRSRASIRVSRRSDSRASSACRWRTGTSPPTSSRPICRCC